MKKIIACLFVVAILTMLFFPCVFIRTASKELLVYPVFSDVDFKSNYIHSVQKTPVTELFKITPMGKIKLYETRYRSYGVGLPFLKTEGNFSQEGDEFVLTMNREFENIAIRTGVGTEQILSVNEKKLALYQILPAGERVEIFVKPYFIGKFLR